MSAEEYPCIFLHQMEAIVYISIEGEQSSRVILLDRLICPFNILEVCKCWLCRKFWMGFFL